MDDNDIIPYWFTGTVEREIMKRTLLDEFGWPSLNEIQSYSIDSCLMRGDLRTARIYLNDFCGKKGTMEVWKWIPGDHYYALRVKFNTLKEAINYLHLQGYSYSGLNEVSIEDYARQYR